MISRPIRFTRAAETTGKIPASARLRTTACSVAAGSKYFTSRRSPLRSSSFFSLITSLRSPTALPGAGLAKTAFSGEDGPGSAVVIAGATAATSATQWTSLPIALWLPITVGLALGQARLLLLAIEPKSPEQGHVLQRKENRRIVPFVRVLVSGRRWANEKVSLFPFVADPIDHGTAGAADDMVDGAARLAVRPSVDSGAHHLEIARHGWENGLPSACVNVLHHHVVERVRLQLREPEKRIVRRLPPVVNQSLRPRARGGPDRD